MLITLTAWVLNGQHEPAWRIEGCRVKGVEQAVSKTPVRHPCKPDRDSTQRRKDLRYTKTVIFRQRSVHILSASTDAVRFEVDRTSRGQRRSEPPHRKILIVPAIVALLPKNLHFSNPTLP